MLERIYFKDINNKIHCYATEKLENNDMKTEINEIILFEKKKFITKDDVVTEYYFSSKLFKDSLTKIKISEKILEKLKTAFSKLEQEVKEFKNKNLIYRVNFKMEFKNEDKIYYNENLVFGKPIAKKISIISEDKDDYQYVLLMDFKLNENSISPSKEYLEVTEKVAKYFDKNI